MVIESVAISNVTTRVVLPEYGLLNQFAPEPVDDL